jgi:uncharacterized protein YjiS (DUF1127 family)
MSRIHLATVVAAFVTASLATNLLLVGVRGQVQSDLVLRLRCRARWLRRRLGHAVDAWVMSMLAYRERQAALHALRYFSDRELKDMGLRRGSCGRLTMLGPDERRAASPIPSFRRRRLR